MRLVNKTFCEKYDFVVPTLMLLRQDTECKGRFASKGISSIVKLPGDVPHSRVYFSDFKSSQRYAFCNFGLNIGPGNGHGFS